MHRNHGFNKGIIQKAHLVIRPPHQPLHNTRHPHGGDVKDNAQCRNPQMDTDQFQGIHFRAAPQARHQIIKRPERDETDPAQRTGMHVTDSPIRIMRQRIHIADRHKRPFKGTHPIEGQRDNHELQNRIFAQLMPRAG